MTKTFESYLAFYNDLKGFDLSPYPSLLFFYNATENSLGCNCGGKQTRAKERFKSLISTFNDNEKQFLKQLYNSDTLTLVQDNLTFVIDL